MSGTLLAALVVPGAADPWSALGFTVVDGAIGLANGAIRVGAASCALELAPAPVTVGVGPQPLHGRGGSARDIEGIPVTNGIPVPAVSHANGAIELDHIVIMTDSLERTSAAVEAALGLEQRRLRETDTVRQGFHRFGDIDGVRGCIIEVVENRRVERPAIWGAVVIVDDLDATVGGGQFGAAKPAVQPGRRIATASRSAGLPIALAVMSR